MRHLFVTDLDGTLLGPDSRVSARSAEIISSLSRRGALISVATARTPATVEPLLRNVELGADAVVMTGAAMWSRATQSYVDPRFIKEETVRSIVDTCRAHGINPMLYTIGPGNMINTYFHGTLTSKEQKFIDERRGLALKRIHVERGADFTDRELGLDTILVFALGSTPAIQRIAVLMSEQHGVSVSSYPDIFNAEVSYLELFAPGVDKASAVLRLKERVGADRLTVFGDNLNDLPMMAVADVAVAVDNALPEVKEAADEVIGPNSDDAVAQYLLTACGGV